MEFLNEKLLSEGLFSSSLQEVSYTDVLEQFKKLNKQLSESLKKTTACKSIKTYKEIYPNIYAISKKDFRMTMQQFISETFSIFELARESELTENIVINELNSIFDELNYAYKDISITFLKTNEGNDTYRFYAYLDFKKCLKNILDYRQPKEQLFAKDMIKEFNDKKDDIIVAIKKHPLGKTLRFDKSYKSEIFKYQAASGSGVCYCLQEENNGFIDRDFSNLNPKVTSWSVSMNLAYTLSETILKNTHITLTRFPNRNGSYSLWLISNPNIKITY